MPLTDEQVSSVLDWMGRTHPLGQKTLNLATATGGAPSGGPVTGPSGSGEGAEGGSAGGTRGTGGPSPILQALSVADLVRRAAGLVRPTQEPPPVPAAGGLAEGGAGTLGPGAQVTADVGAPNVGLSTVGGSLTPAENIPVTESGGPLGGLGGPVVIGATLAADFARRLAAGQSILESAGGAIDAPFTGPSTTLRGLFGDRTPSALTDINPAGRAALGASTMGLSEILGSFFGGGGPSKAWRTFPSRVTEGWTAYSTHLENAWRAVTNAKTVKDLDQAMATYHDQVQAQPGFPWGQSATTIPGTPYQTWDLGGIIQSQSGSRAHGVTLPQNNLGDAQGIFWQLVSAKHQQLRSPSPESSAAPARAPESGMVPGGPSGALGFSRDVLQAAPEREERRRPFFSP